MRYSGEHRSIGRTAGACLLWVCPAVVLSVCWAGAGWAWAQPDPGAAPGWFERDGELQMRHLLDDVKDARQEPERRRRAALILLEGRRSEAVVQLRRLLAAGDPATQRAIAQAIAASDLPDDQLIEPLYTLLASEDAALRTDAAAALGRFDDASLTQRLINSASDAEAPQGVRLGAIAALAEHRTQAVLEQLVLLVESPDAAVRSAAFASLARLSGREDLGENAALWKAYAERVRALPPGRWLAVLMKNVSARNAELKDKLDARTHRLTETYRRLYTDAAEAGRPLILQEMLDDQVTAVRLLSLELIERRMLNAQPVGEEIAEAVRGHMADTDPRVRTKVALLLRDLKDAEGATLATRLLPAESEPAVQAAYLALMARVPRMDTVEPALQLINSRTLRPAAAAVLVAAAEANLLDPEQARRALAATRRHLGAADSPDPAMVHLLGRLGEDSDTDMLVAALNADDPALRLAAAEAIARERWPLDPLLAHADEEALRPVTIAAVSKRGRTAAELLAILRYEPATAEARASWTAAAEAAAARLSADHLIEVDAWLTEADDTDAIHEAILVAAAAPATGNGPSPAPDDAAAAEARRVEASFRLAGLYRRTSQPAKARAVLARLAERNHLPAVDARRLAVARLALLLDDGQIDDAAKSTTDSLAAANAPSADDLAEPWLIAAELALAESRPTTAGRLAVQVENLLGEGLTAPQRARLADLVARIKKAVPSPTVPAAPTAAPVSVAP